MDNSVLKVKHASNQAIKPPLVSSVYERRQQNLEQNNQRCKLHQNSNESSRHLPSLINVFAPETVHVEPEIIIPEAFVVDTNSSTEIVIPSAEIVMPEKCSLTVGGRKIHFGIFAMLALIMIAIALVTSLTMLAAKNDIPLLESSTLKPALTGMSKQAIIDEIEEKVFQRNNTFNNLQQSDSRCLALDWILNNNTFLLNAVHLNLCQRYILALLAFEFSTSFRSNFDWLSNKEECKWHGVLCVNGKVHELELGKNFSNTKTMASIFSPSHIWSSEH